MICPYCGQEHPDNFKFCPETGQPIPQLKACTNSDCPNHGKHILPLDAKFCPRCGSPLEKAKEVERQTKPLDSKKTSQIVVVCSEDGAFIQIGKPKRNSKKEGERLHRLCLKEGENIITVEEHLDLRYGFSFTNDDNPNKIIQFVLDDYDTSNVTDMSYMFSGCSSLQKLDLSNFDTSKVTDMCHMFSGCSSLEELDLSGFDTSNVTCLFLMFCGCSSLEKLDLSNFDTSKVTDMCRMFDGCSSLEELDLSGFDTSNVTDMRCMFDGCSSLEKLGLGSFNTFQVKDMIRMFDGYYEKIKNKFKK